MLIDKMRDRSTKETPVDSQEGGGWYDGPLTRGPTVESGMSYDQIMVGLDVRTTRLDNRFDELHSRLEQNRRQIEILQEDVSALSDMADALSKAEGRAAAARQKLTGIARKVSLAASFLLLLHLLGIGVPMVALTSIIIGFGLMVGR